MSWGLILLVYLYQVHVYKESWDDNRGSYLYVYLHCTNLSLTGTRCLSRPVTPIDLPTDGGLAVRGPLRGTEGLTHLGLGQTQGQPSNLELFGKLLDLV